MKGYEMNLDTLEASVNGHKLHLTREHREMLAECLDPDNFDDPEGAAREYLIDISISEYLIPENEFEYIEKESVHFFVNK